MNRTGLFVLIAAAIVVAAGAFWYISRSVTTQPASAPQVAVDTSAAPAPADEPAEESAAPTAPPADALGGAIAPEPESKDAARGDADKAERRAQASHNDDAKPDQGYAAAPPPPPAPSAAIAPPAATRSEEIPLFPWPVPKASATQDVPRKLIIGNTSTPTFGSVAERIASALDHAGYGERSYYALAGGHGIAIATQIEQINDDGTPVVGVARFEGKPAAPSTEQFSLTSYVKALFTVRPGRFRIIVFTLSGTLPQGARPPSEQEAKTWATSGQTHLPQRYALIPFTNEVTCTALVYEFEKKDYAAASFVDHGKLNAMSHLVKTGIWALLGSP